MDTLFSELRRRHVFKVAAAYGVVAWLLIQVAATTFPAFGTPAWVLRVVIALAVLGFPVALVLAWAFELTPDGVRRAEPLASGGEPSGTRRQRSLDGRVAGWVGVGMLVGLVSVGAYGWDRLPPTRNKGRGEVGNAITRSIAVLPFSNASPSSSDAYLSDGLAEEVLNALSQVPQLRVAARTSSFGFQGQNVSLDSIARALSVDHLLEGSVRRAGDRVRIVARLVDVSTGSSLWSQTYNRELNDVLAVQEEIAAAIANALQVKLAGGDAARLVRSRTADPEAYELYLQGRQLASKRTKEELHVAVQRFEAALRRDPAFAAAYSGLADAYALLEDYGGLHREEAFSKAIAAAQRALEIDELQAEAHASMGHIYFHQENWNAAEREHQRAIELNPSYAAAYHWYANLLNATGRPAEALQALERAHQLDPLSVTIRGMRGAALVHARQFDRAIQTLRELRDADEENWRWHYHLSWGHLGAGDYAEMIAVTQRMIEVRWKGEAPSAWARAHLAGAYAAAGRREEAVQILSQLEGEIPADRADAPYWMAMAYGYLGDHDRAFHWLDRALRRHWYLRGLLAVHPAFDPLRPDPRFAAFVKRAEHTP